MLENMGALWETRAKQTFTMPNGPTYEYTYHDNNDLQTIEIPDDGMITYPSYTMSRPDNVTFPGGSQQSYTYDALMRIEQISATASGLDYEYDYDNVSNILTKTTEHGNYIYDYDDAYRLTTADNPVLDDEAYIYDGVGNRETALGVTGDIIHNENNELTLYGEIEYDYDANGNMTQKRVGLVAVNYIYDAANRLVKVEDDATQTVIAEYFYDPFGRRLWKDVGGTRTYFLYADEGLVAEYNDTGNEIRSYGYKPDSIWTTDPLWLKEGGSYYWYQNDHVGAPQKLIDMNGTVIWSAQYRAFGEAVVDVATITNNLRFPGQYYDDETGLHYNWFRYYDPGIGRYLRVDPIGFAGGDENQYAFVSNNPVKWGDPWGLNAEVLVTDAPAGAPWEKHVLIIIPIIFKGPGATPDAVERFERCIEETWTGLFGKYNVNTNVITGDVAGVLYPKPNIIHVPIGKSIDALITANVVNWCLGTWPDQISCDSASHEAGHLMGLGEGYIILPGFKCKDKEGKEGNIMGCASGDGRRVPFEKDIEKIIKRAPSPYNQDLLNWLGIRP